MILSLGTNVFASSSNDIQVLQTEAGTLYKGSKGSIEYLEDVGGYYLENVTKDELLEAFDTAFKKTPDSTALQANDPQLSEDFINKSRSVLADKNVDLSAARVGTYTESYTLDFYIPAAFEGDEDVHAYHRVEMKMTTVVYQGREYAMFVDFYLKPGILSLDSGEYELASGTGEPLFEILNSGATLSVTQWVQLQTSQTYELGVDVSAGWVGVSTGTGSTQYFRNTTDKYYDTVNLPLINVVT